MIIMKQRIRVVAIMGDRRRHTRLLIHRAPSRLEESIGWELPMGKILLGEQPEDAMIRVVAENLGVKVDHLSLIDVVTANNLRTSSQVYNLFILYRVDADLSQIRLDPRFSSYKLTRERDIRTETLEEASSILLRVIDSEAVGRLDTNTLPPAPTGQKRLLVYTDGGSRGNPGPAAIGYHIVTEKGEELARGGEFIGEANSRQAEYLALRRAAEIARALGGENVSFLSDSLMVVSQMNGVYQVKNRDLWGIVDEVDEILHHFSRYTFNHIPRSQNAIADAEVNKVLDARAKGYYQETLHS
jgi:ribonuclease HI/8-oxo-dGTP pyrophosphatase MutT (NUDIX family)